MIEVPDPLAQVGRPVPSHLDTSELKPWLKPSANACFPIHRLGVKVLAAHATRAADETGVPASLDDASKAQLESEIWRASHRAFAPGQTIRGGVEKMVSEISSPISHGPVTDDARRGQICAFAKWAVARGCVSLAEAAK